MHPGEIWNGRSLGARVARIGLFPASVLYGLGWQTYLAMYRLGVKKAVKPHHPIVCIGNLLAGGGGKSPMTVHLVEVLREMGREVVVGASGYGSPRSEAASLAPDGHLNPAEWGDEPAMLRWLIPDLPLIVGRRRVLAAEICHRSHPGAVLLMDDGFQHLPLHKDLTILLDPANPFNRLCLPAGPYREPRTNRSRADIVIPGHFKVVSQPLRFVDPAGNSVAPKSPSVLCALARPEAFLEALASSGVKPVSQILLPDHDTLDAGTLLETIPSDRPVVVTAKDWVKLRERSDVESRSFVIALQSTAVEPKAEFRDWLKNRLDGTGF
jgi:tetraacyldisaccharide 4'-kinase